jgi:hypothetical protein
MSHQARPKGVPAAHWPAPASEPRRERPARSAEASTNYFSVAQSFVVGLRIFAEGELVPSLRSHRREGRPRAPRVAPLDLPGGRFTAGAMKQRNPAKTAARGYGSAHQARRRRWNKRIYSGEEVNCARCGHPILPGQAWDLGHDDNDRTRYTGPEHRRCNRATATHKAKRSRRTSYAFVDEQPCKVSRQW